ncbi:MAG: 3-dehydroquinate synthase [Epulopiscium sp.]|nr:3-dehydroquinate synthase [Candidatus Epulonipiscium sp.]
MNQIIVNTPSATYPIYFSQSFPGILTALDKHGLSNKKICIITDDNVDALYGQELLDLIKTQFKEVYKFTFPAGEDSKNLQTVQETYQFFVKNHMDRNSLVLALGGGVTGDMAGFAAATYMRGIPFIQIPTTLLSQVDSSVGGKVGVDFLQNKNMIGAFYQPVFVYINLNTLRTLPKNQLSSGMGEVIKHGLILDRDYFSFIEDSSHLIFNLDKTALESIIKRSCQLKAGVVSQDEKESGLREILNFGHTIGHSIETLLNFKLLHGECVSIGIVGAAYISYKKNLITKDALDRIERTLKCYDLPTRIDCLNPEDIYNQMLLDKKTKNNIIHFVLLSPLGQAIRTGDLTSDLIKAAISYIQKTCI